MMQEVEVLKTIQELICSFFSEEQFTLSKIKILIESASIIRYDRRSNTNESGLIL